MKSVCENKLKVIDHSQKDKLSYIEWNRKAIMQHNRQNSRLIGHKDKIKAGMVTYSIPSIVNGRLLSKNISEPVSAISPFSKRVSSNARKGAVTVAHKSHKNFYNW
jgi:hypothetical protein